MKTRNVIAVLVAIGFVAALSVPASADMLPGVSGDGVVDLYVDVVPEGYEGPEEVGMWIDTDGITINGYAIRSESKSLTGDPAMQINWVFKTDEDDEIASAFVVAGMSDPAFTGIHYLGDVMGPPAPTKVADPDLDLFADLSMEYTDENQDGLFYGTLIVPEPGTMMMLLCGAIGMLLAWRRRS